MINSLSDP